MVRARQGAQGQLYRESCAVCTRIVHSQSVGLAAASTHADRGGVPFTIANIVPSCGYSRNDAPFRLRSFETSIRCASPFFVSLSRGMGFSISPLLFTYIAVPSRSTTIADFVPAQMIAMCPVNGILLSLFSKHRYRAFEVLARTSTHVRPKRAVPAACGRPSLLRGVAHRGPRAIL